MKKSLWKILVVSLTLVSILTLAFAFVACNPTDKAPDYSNIPSPNLFTGSAKNVIMMIGDGMGQEHIEATKILLKETMENAVQLSVPLIVEIGVADNWKDAH